ncbi:hypothetical protein AYO21_07974 [Fonsecaea monophora]|uniref:Sterigmatocystin biosynthesis monooxygenase stcW n=1 Tax=Fonsecaea monophora TaxID=254056 RepID=A0A177F0V4_9EURO|nr:hypothetical protein AYO21_07974 [Fonsecaea monophora]OAG37868.1 hypothetical protein AYO21_07974 [Fonsecaea monophora]
MAPDIGSLNGSAVLNGGHSLTNETSKFRPELYGWPTQNERGYRILEQPFNTKRPIRVIHIGAGASGICFAKFHETMTENVTIQLYEKNSDIGGTWLENRYPGCACDIPSATYQFTWAPNPDWTHYYSTSPEIWRYFKDVVEKHDLAKYIKLNHEVIGAEWNEEEGLWHVSVRDANGQVFEDTCNVLLNGTGILNKWKWPDIQGLDSFQGTLMHSAHYTEDFDLTNKRVAVIGAGSSGIQIIAAITSQVKELYCWVRSPTWVTAGFGQKFAGPDGGNFEYTEEEKEQFRKNPDKFLRYSKLIETELNQRFKYILKGTPEAVSSIEFSRKEMCEKLGGDAKLIDAIVPKDFGVGCRRPTPGPGFLEALREPHVTVFVKSIGSITEKGFIDHEGVEHEVDVIICATGFDTSFVPRFSVVANGVNIQDMWRKELLCYLSVAAPSIPNFWVAGGPYGPLGHGSILPLIETWMKYFIQCINKIQVDRIKSLTAKESISRAFKEHADLLLQRTAWTQGCSSWFKQGKTEGPVSIFPGSRITYIEILETPRYEDYDITYLNPSNPMEILGNGFSTREFNGKDLSHYLGLIDGKDEQLDLEAEFWAVKKGTAA